MTPITSFDRLNKYNPTPKLGMIESTTLAASSRCSPTSPATWGQSTVSKMLLRQDGKVEIDYPKLAERIRLAA